MVYVMIYVSASGECKLGVCDTANFGIDPIPSKYRASIADTNPDTDTCHLKKNIHLNDQ